MPDDTNRTCSAHGTASTIASASSMPSRLLAKKVVPRAICACAASVTSGWQWPTSIGPEPSRIVDVLLAVFVPDAAGLALADHDLAREIAERAARQHALRGLEDVVLDRVHDILSLNTGLRLHEHPASFETRLRRSSG